jgi:uncharacterized membrane protein YhfC
MIFICSIYERNALLVGHSGIDAILVKISCKLQLLWYNFAHENQRTDPRL